MLSLSAHPLVLLLCGVSLHPPHFPISLSKAHWHWHPEENMHGWCNHDEGAEARWDQQVSSSSEYLTLWNWLVNLLRPHSIGHWFMCINHLWWMVNQMPPPILIVQHSVYQLASRQSPSLDVEEPPSHIWSYLWSPHQRHDWPGPCQNHPEVWFRGQGQPQLFTHFYSLISPIPSLVRWLLTMWLWMMQLSVMSVRNLTCSCTPWIQKEQGASK